MPKFFVNSNQIKNNKIEIINQDVKHIRTVLRAKIGDEINICDNQSKKNYICNIIEINKEKIICQIKEEAKENTESNIKVTIFQGLPKFDKMEFIIQKAVELGVYDIEPVEMKRCVVKLDEKDKPKKISRWQKISEVAAKQCGRDIIPQIKNIINLKNICNLIEKYDIVLVAYENEKNNTLKNEIEKLKNNKKENKKIGIIIGPEGGLEKSEVEFLNQNGAKIITLGKRILRTETASLNILSILMYELEN